jgi:hypothetical protein
VPDKKKKRKLEKRAKRRKLAKAIDSNGHHKRERKGSAKGAGLHDP